MRNGKIGVAFVLLSFGGLLGSLSADQKELRECRDKLATEKSELQDCRDRLFDQLKTVANYLEPILIKLEAPPEVPERQPLPASPVAAPNFGPMTVERIELLALAVRERFDALQKEQEGLRLQIAASRDAATAGNQATLAELERLRSDVAELSSQVFASQRLREDAAAQRQAREVDRAHTRAAVEDLVSLLKSFDSGRITCKDCKQGFSEAFRRQLLSFHREMLARLEGLQTSVESP